MSGWCSFSQASTTGAKASLSSTRSPPSRLHSPWSNTSPVPGTGETKADGEAAKAGVKQQIAFYSSTRTYHSVLEHHGWGEIGRTLHALSIEGKWQGMLDQISDEILDAFSIVATHDELASKLKERWGGVSSTIFLGLSPQMLANESLVRGIVDELHRP